MFFSFFGFINCLYFNCCYCCCYRFIPKEFLDEKSKRLFVFLIISTVIYVLAGVINESFYLNFSTYMDHTFCQLGSTNIIMMTSGVNLTYTQNRGQIDNSINWSGLHYLMTQFNLYVSDLNSIKNTLYKNYSYLSNVDPIQIYYSNLQNGIGQFIEFANSNPFKINDPNGDTLSQFKLTYTCSACQDTSQIVTIYKEINDTLYQLQNDLSRYRMKIYSDIFDSKGWQKIIQSHNSSYLEMKKDAYKTYKFYDIVSTSYEDINSTLDILKYIQFFVFVANAIICGLGVWGYTRVMKSVQFLKSKSKEEPGKNEETKSVETKNKKEKSNPTSVQGRWSFHLVINFNTFTAVIISLFAYILLCGAVFIYESGTVMKNNFYNNHTMKNFYFIPNGDLIDLCESLGNVNGRYNFTYFYNYYTDMINYSTNLTNFYISGKATAIPKYDLINKTIKSMDLSEFHSISNKSLRWDPEGEQINYFLFPLSKYKYINTPPEEVMIQFTNFYYNPPSDSKYPNFQKKYCSKLISADIWVDSVKTCDKFENVKEKSTQITPVKQDFISCLNMGIKLPDETCKNVNIPNCYVEYYDDRYKGELDFDGCSVPETELEFSDSSADFFQDKITQLLINAKFEYLMQQNMTTYLSSYMSYFNSMIDANLVTYKKELQKAFNFYKTLVNYFIQMRKWFIENQNTTYINDVLDKNGLMKISTCTWIKNNTKVFYYSDNILSETLFGISIIYIFMIIFLFSNASFAIVAYFRLRTPNEISEISTNLATIKAIEDKERRFFFADNVFIDSDDMIEMDLVGDEKKNNKSEEDEEEENSKESKNFHDNEKILENFFKNEEKELTERYNKANQKRHDQANLNE